MTSSEERRRLMNLAEGLDRDPADDDDETIAADIRDAERSAADLIQWSARRIAILKGRHPWSKVVELTGMPQTTLHNRIYPRRSKRASDESPPASE